MSITINSKMKIITITIPLLILIIIGFTSAIAGTFTCTSNVCTGSDGFTMAESQSIFHFGLSAIDSFAFSEKGILSSAAKLIVSDLFKFTDINNFKNSMIKIIDSMSIIESSILNGNIVTTVTTYVTSVIDQLVASCSGSSCYSNASATGMEAIAEQIIFPLIFILGTVFGFMYMGLKFFGISVMVATFILLGLAYIGIIPSYFTLLTIIAVGAALTKMVNGMLGNSQSNAS